MRNGSISGADRKQLIIDPGPRTIAGRNQKGDAYKFSGAFFGKEVCLGELRTDDKGRLMVFGGDGKSASSTGAPAVTFANNDGWHDDVSDGTVRATVTVEGKKMEAAAAIVTCTPPNFAPGLFSVVTMYDVVYDLYVREGWVTEAPQVSFWLDIWPILQRLSGAQWVNEGFFMLFGKNSPSDFTDPELIRLLSNPAAESQKERSAYSSGSGQPMPRSINQIGYRLITATYSGISRICLMWISRSLLRSTTT